MLGMGLFFGRSSTQIADFIRRTAELIAIIVSWIVFRIVNNVKGTVPLTTCADNVKRTVPLTMKRTVPLTMERKRRLERIAGICVGAAMCLSGVAMIFVSLFSSSMEKGNVIPALVIAILGVTTNTWFWLRYSKLNRERPDVILASQSRLYFAKSLVDACITLALAVIVIAPDSLVSQYVDLGGSIVVAIYLMVSGITAMRRANAEDLSSDPLSS